MANPLFRRSYATLMSRPLGAVPGLRAVNPPAQAARPQSRLSPLDLLARSQQLRPFGSGSVTRSILASREAAANRNPQSASAQHAFYQTLLSANMPGIVIQRYQSGTNSWPPVHRWTS